VRDPCAGKDRCQLIEQRLFGDFAAERDAL
jgi:hypothetical protein